MVYLFVPLMVLSLVGVLENIPKDVLQASSSLAYTQPVRRGRDWESAPKRSAFFKSCQLQNITSFLKFPVKQTQNIF